MNNNPSRIDHTELYKLSIDYMKHITTLSSGSIVVTASFLSSVFQNPKWIALIILAFIAFLASIIGAMIVILFLLIAESVTGHTEGIGERIEKLAVFTAVGGFVVGIICLALFGIRNFLG